MRIVPFTALALAATLLFISYGSLVRADTYPPGIVPSTLLKAG